ncbi:hypothetical protein BFP97_18495 [Roseivirga sp. 4D4]|nr:hypothetical protein BFP97_18495 [Roseivirga sp. 4D4]
MSIATTLLGQSSIKGRVKDEKTGQPIQGVHVFVNGTQLGALTDINGFYKIDGIRLTEFRLIFSFVGYESKAFDIENFKGLITVDAALKESARFLGSVEVNAKKNRRRERYLQGFREFLYGENYEPSLIEIENEYMLDFKGRGGKKFVVEGEPVLDIINSHLGYKIYFQLTEFEYGKNYLYHGYSQFIEMESKSETQKEEWLKNRSRAYLGSMRHFFKSLIEDRIQQEGYEASMTVYNADFESNDNWLRQTKNSIALAPRNRPVESVDKRDIEKDSKENYIIYLVSEGLYEIDFEDILEVSFLGKQDSKTSQKSQIKLKEPLFVYQNGVVKNPGAIALMGFWSKRGIYDLLPTDYVPVN